MNIDPVALSQLPFAAFLILSGITFFTLLGRGILRWQREIEVAIASEAEWKVTAQKSTATCAELVTQVTTLTQVVATLTRVVEQKVAA